MPLTDEITIHPKDLKKIVSHLKLIKWNQGMVIIRDTGTQYIIRDKDENKICTIDQSNEESDDG
jgi:hypothetical protein